MRVALEPAFVLHATPYRDTSLLVNFFTQNQGRVMAIAQSARGPRSRFRGCLMPFSPLLINFTGKNDLMYLNAVDSESAAYFLQGNNLFNGFYLNELLIKLLQRLDPYPNLFLEYRETLVQLQTVDCNAQKILRLFEKKLLAELGYGLQLTQAASGHDVLPGHYYTYHLERGLIACKDKTQESAFLGDHLLAIENNQLLTNEILQEAKRLMRFIINALLSHQPLKTRELFTICH